MGDSIDMLDSANAVPVDQDGEAVQNDERVGVAITERVKESIRRFLDTQSFHSTGLTIDFVKSISFEDLIKYLRKNEVIAVTNDMLQVIHDFHSSSNYDVQYFIGQHNFNVRIFLAAYMIALYPGHVFESMGNLETKLTASSTALLINLEAILDHVWTSANLSSVSCALIDAFPQLVATYFDDFQKWKEPDEADLKGRILNALRSLHTAAQTLPVSDEEALGITHTDFEDQIARLRVKLSAIGGQAELDNFDALLQAGVAAGPPSQVTSSPNMAQYLTNEQLLQYASRLTRAAVFHNVRTQTVTNVQIAHELLIDPSFQFEDDFSIGGEGKIINQPFINVFWGDVLEDLKKPEPSYNGMFRVLEDIRDGISDVAGDEHALSLETQTTVDINHIKTSRQLEVWSSCVDLFTKIFYLILRTQTQKREDEAKTKWDCLQTAMQEAQPEDQPQAMCDTVRFFSNQVNLMRIDASNARIRLIADVIKTNGVAFEQGKFQERLDNGTLTLEHTTKWLSNEIDNIKVKQLKQLVNGNMEALRSVHHSALVKFIVDPTQVGNTPEVLNLDLHRIAYFSKQYQKLVNCATVMRVINRFMSPGGPQLDTDLESISRMVLASDPRKVEDVESIFDIIMQTPLQHVISSDHMKEMRIDMEKIFLDPYFDMLTIVSKRIVNYWKQFNVLQADTEPLHSVYAVSPLITEEARQLSAFVALNIKIHLPVFTRIIAQVAKASVMPVDSSDGMEQVEPTVSNPLAAPSGSFEEI